VEEIAAVPGLGRRTAEAVHAALAGAVAATPAVDPTTGEIVEEPAKSEPLPPDRDAVGVGGSDANR